MLKLFIFIIIVCLLIVGVVLGVLNPDKVVLDLFIIKTTLPLGLVLAVTLVIGTFLGVVISSFKMSQLKWQLRKQVKANKKQLSQIIQLKKELSLKDKGLSGSSSKLINIEKTG